MAENLSGLLDVLHEAPRAEVQSFPQQILPPLRDLGLFSNSERGTPQEEQPPQSYDTKVRRYSLPPRANKTKEEYEEEEEFQETMGNSPLVWRRTSLDGNAAIPRLRNAPKPKSQDDDWEEEVIVPERRHVRKRSISEDVGDHDFITSESEDEKPKKTKIKKSTRGRRGKKGFDCGGKEKCALCRNGTPYYLQKSMNPGWRETLLAVFEHFVGRITYRDWMKRQKEELGDTIEIVGSDDLTNKERIADTEWLYLPDAYGFLEHHWEILCPPQHKNRSFNGTNWRKTLQDTLSHNRTYFISGKDLFGKTGFWRLADNIPVQNGVVTDSRVFMDMKFRQMAPKPPSMFTIDAILKKAEAQGQIPSFCGSYNSVVNNQQPISFFVPQPTYDVVPPPETFVPSPSSDLDLLVNAIEKFHSS